MLILVSTPIRRSVVAGAAFRLMASRWSGRKLLPGMLRKLSSWTRISMSLPLVAKSALSVSRDAAALRPESFPRGGPVSSRGRSVAVPTRTPVLLWHSRRLRRRRMFFETSGRRCSSSRSATLPASAPLTGSRPRRDSGRPFLSGSSDSGSTGRTAFVRAYPWVRLQPRVRRPRGFVVIRVGVSGGSGSEGTRHLYLVEIQRRALEKFSGLVFDLERRDDSVEALRAWVDALRRRLPLRRGVFASLLDDCPGKAATYQHLSLDHDRVRQETGVRNALRKMGVPRAALERSTG